MPADDATGPGGRADSVGFYAYADDTPRVIPDTRRPPAHEPGTEPASPRGSGLVVAAAVVLLAGTAIGFAWTVTGPGREVSDSRTLPTPPAPAPAPSPAEAAPFAAETTAQPEPPAPATARVEPTTPPHRARPARPHGAQLTQRHRAPATARPHKAAAHPRASQPHAVPHRAVVRHAAAPRPGPPIADIGEIYAQSIADIERRNAASGGGEPPH